MNLVLSLVRLKTKRTAYPKLMKIEVKINWVTKTVHVSERKRNKSNSEITATASWFSLQFLQVKQTKCRLTLSTMKRKEPGGSKVLEERSEAQGISRTLSM
jgi:hypothetical protein